MRVFMLTLLLSGCAQIVPSDASVLTCGDASHDSSPSVEACTPGSGWRVCAGQCVQETLSNDNCGGCNVGCGMGQSCRSSRYGAACCVPRSSPGECLTSTCQAMFYPASSGLVFCAEDGACCMTP